MTDPIAVSQRAREAAEVVLRRIERGLFPAHLDRVAEAFARFEAETRKEEWERTKRRTFPILGGQGAVIDYQLVADHGKQARENHYQTVDRLAERGGLSWCELHAVLHNRKWQKMDDNDALIACRAMEARYLAAIRNLGEG